MNNNINERLQSLRRALPEFIFEVVSRKLTYPDDKDPSDRITEQIVIYDFPYSPDYYTSEVTLVRFSDCEKIFFKLKVEWLDPRDVDGLFDGISPSELRENFLAESGAIEDIYDFWRLSLGELGYGLNEVGFKDIMEIDIQKEDIMTKFTLRIEFSLELKTFDEVIEFLSRLNKIRKGETETKNVL